MTEVVLAQAANCSAEEAASQWRPTDQRNAKFAKCGKQIHFGFATPKRIFKLHCSDRVNFVCTPHLFGGYIAQANIADFPITDPLCHRLHCFLDRRSWIGVVCIPQVNDVDTQTMQARVESLAHIKRRAIDLERETPARRQICSGLAFVEDDSEFRGHEGILASARDGTPYPRFIVAITISISRINHVHPGIKRLADDLNCLLAIRCSVIAFKNHRAIAQASHTRTSTSKPLFLNHDGTSDDQAAHRDEMVDTHKFIQGWTSLPLDSHGLGACCRLPG